MCNTVKNSGQRGKPTPEAKKRYKKKFSNEGSGGGKLRTCSLFQLTLSPPPNTQHITITASQPAKFYTLLNLLNPHFPDPLEFTSDPSLNHPMKCLLAAV